MLAMGVAMMMGTPVKIILVVMTLMQAGLQEAQLQSNSMTKYFVLLYQSCFVFEKVRQYAEQEKYNT